LIGDCIAYHHEREYFLLIRFMGLEKAGKGVAAARGVAHKVTDQGIKIAVGSLDLVLLPAAF
jgi:hypothetical protein